MIVIRSMNKIAALVTSDEKDGHHEIREESCEVRQSARPSDSLIERQENDEPCKHQGRTDLNVESHSFVNSRGNIQGVSVPEVPHSSPLFTLR